nr:centrosomal protein of 170 kDa protein B isoform X2 [Nothobranchius furzeri]
MSVTSWFLVSSSGTRHRLPREMIFVGRDDCELMLQSRSVDKQHAVINYDPNTDEHMVKDLGSLNGTFVNDLRIPDQTYITLKLSDVIRFGYDAHVYILEKSQHKVPEEALKHEKYTSQLQLSIKALEAKSKEKQQQQLQSSEKSKDAVSSLRQQDRAERRARSLTAPTDSPISKPTPLYGQPSWWGEDEDPANAKQNREPAKEVGRSQSDSHAKSTLSCRREPSYFEIPTEEFQQQPTKKQVSQVHEVPTRDSSDTSQSISSTPTPPVVQSHASFTIEFDDCTPGKMKIKDHVTKFALRQTHKQAATEAATAPTEVMSAESKVADWLVQSNASLLRKMSQGENLYKAGSHSSGLRITAENYSENGARSDSGHPAINGKDFVQSEAQDVPWVSSRTSPDSEELLSHSPPESQSLSSHSKSELQQTFVIEFDDSRKRLSQVFTSTTPPPEPTGHRLQLENASKPSSPSVERHVLPSSSSTPSTQRYTIPLKDSSSSGFQRAGSLRREKTEDRISTSFYSRSSSSASSRPFSSVGRKSKLSREFTAELLKQKQNSSSSWEKDASSSPKAALKRAEMVFQSNKTSASPPLSERHHQPQTSSPVDHPVPLKTSTTSTLSVDVKGPRNEDEDDLSDAGTYTIEADVQDKELEEARKKINQVFGVVESPEPINQSQAETSSAFRPAIGQGREEVRQGSCGEVKPAPEQGQVQRAAALAPGAPKWMSCWASLADSYMDSGPPPGLFDIPSQMELSGGVRGAADVPKTALGQHLDSSDADASKARRILPQVPQGEKSDIPTPSIYVHYNPNSTFDVKDGCSAALETQDGAHMLTVQDDVEPDSLSDASKSEDGSIIEHSKGHLSDPEDKPTPAVKATAFYIGSEERSKPQRGAFKATTPKAERKLVNKTFSTATLTKQKDIQVSDMVKSTASEPILGQNMQRSEGKEAAAPSLFRQESFTKDRPSNARLPNISSLPAERDPEPGFIQGGGQDTQSYLRQTEDVLAVLTARLHPEATPSPTLDSPSGDSDVDTSSTVSHHSNNTKTNTLLKKTAADVRQRDTFSSNVASQDSNHRPEKPPSCGLSRTEAVRRTVGLRHGVGRAGSVDLSDEPQSLPYSDQESSSSQTHRKYTVPFQKEDGKTPRMAQALSRTSSLSAPRPTRASMLRKARLGEASDNEGTETDRLSQEASNALVKNPQEPKKLSRLDMLAMPRRRTSSFNTPSDTESSSTPQWTSRSAGSSNRNTDVSSTSNQRTSTAPPTKPAERPLKAALSRPAVTRSRSVGAKYASSTASSRRRQKGSDYTSTSDEEYDSNWTNFKHKRSQPSSASHSPRGQPRPQPVVARHPKPRSSRESDEENREGEAFHSWSAHSAEIARLSQDLAKDLAILAREIHDVAGDGDAQTPTGEHSAPTAHEKVHQAKQVPQIPESGSEQVQPKKEPEQNSRKLAHTRDEVTVGSLMLSPVYEVTAGIRESTQQLADKIKMLFQDRMDVWEDTEARMNSDVDDTVGKSSNKEIVSILKELRGIKMQLEVINAVMGPSDTPEAAKTSAPAVSSSSSDARFSRTPPRDWRTVHSVFKRGGGPRPSESVRRAAVTPDDLREGYLV